MSEIGLHVTKISTWNPSKSESTEQFTYIDLSSVNKNTKTVSLENSPSILPVDAPSRARQIINVCDVIVATVRPNLNGVAIIPNELDMATASTGYCILRVNGKTLYSKYLYYWVRTNVYIQDMIRKATGANYPAVSDKIIKESLIPIPFPNDIDKSLIEQKRIAAILEKADYLKKKRRQAIKLANEFLRSVFLDMFGDPVTNSKQWTEYVLKDIADIRSGVTKGKKIDLGKSLTLPYMRVANVQDGYLDLTEVKNIVVSPKDAEKCLLQKGDVLLTEGGDPDKLGRGYIWNNEVEQCLHQNHIFSVRIKDQSFVKPEFLSALISSPRGKRYFLKVGKQTTGIATINKTVLSEFVTFIPPIELQQKYIDIKNKIDQQKLNFNQDDLNLFNSLSQRAFSGKL